MGHTVDAAVSHVLRHIEGRNRNAIERLDGSISTTIETITLEFGNRNITNGAYIEVDYEMMYVYDSAGVGVLRGQSNTSAASHTDDSLVTIEPRVSRQHVVEAMVHTIDDLPDNIFTVTTVTLTFAAGKSHTELTGATGKEVFWATGERDPDPSAKDPYLRPRLHVIRNDAVTSGWVVQLEHGASYQQAQTIEVTYASRYDTSTFSTSTDLNIDVGLSSGMIGTIEYGTIARVLMGEETARNTLQTQAAPRRSEEVPPGVMMEVAREWKRMFDVGVANEASRLRREYPILETA